jgi:hypothetical protein
MHISSHPPDFVSFPWFNVTIRVENPPVTITDTILASAITTQLGLTPNTTSSHFACRFQSVRVWGQIISPNASGILPPVNVLVFDPVTENANGHVLEQLTAYPDMFQRSAVGYHYPKAQREIVRRLVGNTPILALVPAAVGTVVYFSLQLRINITTPPSVAMSNDFVPATAPPAGWFVV